MIKLQLMNDEAVDFYIEAKDKGYFLVPHLSDGTEIVWHAERTEQALESVFSGSLEDCYKFIKEDYEDSIGS